MPKFNAEQKAAIYARNPFLLCAAGAGSGKTTVMVESVNEKLRENISKDISSFLIITFTNEAAGNMKRKVQERLAEEARSGAPHAVKGLSNLENATISTIHSFCKGLIERYFYAIEGMSPRFDIIEEARLRNGP
ncbi:MAG: UvrD-helicase domain-containing protein [Lachnospiraceae bacterium]|nr:UvrD-helicase domain-containing protein [Lachnospiraceae bacterium]